MLTTISTGISMAIHSDVTAVIRSAGERTNALCYELLCEQIPPKNIVLIHEHPFTRALRKSFEVGIELGRPWTLCVDADTLLRKNSVQRLLTCARTADSKLFQIQTNVFDKLFGVPKKAGVRLYRTSLFPKALDYIPANGVSQRPETFVRDRMVSLGYSSVYEPVTVGLHDFEQYYRDLYRKAFVHAHKHDSETRRVEPLWQRLAEQDFDYQAVLWGLRDGRLFEGIVPLDVRHFPQELDYLRCRGLEEKQSLPRVEPAHWDVDKLMVQYGQMRVRADSPLKT